MFKVAYFRIVLVKDWHQHKCPLIRNQLINYGLAIQWNTMNPLKSEQVHCTLVIKKAFQDVQLRKRSKAENGVYTVCFNLYKSDGGGDI